MRSFMIQSLVQRIAPLLFSPLRLGLEKRLGCKGIPARPACSAIPVLIIHRLALKSAGPAFFALFW